MELERAVMEHVAGVAEVAAVGVPAPGGGPEQLHLFIVPQAGSSSGSSGGSRGGSSGGSEAELKAACNAVLRQHLNPLFKVEAVLLRTALPRTASNKVMRRVLRDELMPRSRL